MARNSGPHTADEITVAPQDQYYPNLDNAFGSSFHDDQITAQWLQDDSFPDFLDPQLFPGEEWVNPIPANPVLEHQCWIPGPNLQTPHRGTCEEKAIETQPVVEAGYDSSNACLEQTMLVFQRETNARLNKLEEIISGLRTE